MVVLLPVLGMQCRRNEGVGASVAPSRGVPNRYGWVTSDVWGVPSRMTEGDLQRLRDQGAICGGGEEEGRYELVLPEVDEMVCYLNLDLPTVPDWMWVYESLFTRLGMRLPFSPLVQALLSL